MKAHAVADRGFDGPDVVTMVMMMQCHIHGADTDADVILSAVTAMQELCSVNYLVASGSCERKQGSIPGKEYVFSIYIN